MKVKYGWGALLAAGMICGIGADLTRTFGPGLAAAAVGHARTYTRKRVHGRWVTGRFRDRDGTRGRAVEAQRETPIPPERFAALQTSASDLPADAASVDAKRREQLQRALETRAQEIAIVRPAVDDARSLQPRSVSFDFESGLKTTTFPDERIVRESFDVAAARALASTPPGPTAAP